MALDFSEWVVNKIGKLATVNGDCLKTVVFILTKHLGRHFYLN